MPLKYISVLHFKQLIRKILYLTNSLESHTHTHTREKKKRLERMLVSLTLSGNFNYICVHTDMFSNLFSPSLKIYNTGNCRASPTNPINVPYYSKKKRQYIYLYFKE